jgi:hypothetical protein
MRSTGLTGDAFLLDCAAISRANLESHSQPRSVQDAKVMLGNDTASIIFTRSFSGPSGMMP